MHLKIDNIDVEAQPGMTVLEAAQKAGIEIPTLCAHKDLTPFGACRLCIVDIEGMRGLNTACTTPAADGMVVQTNTPEIQSERYQTLQLLLSRHPSGCLVCDQGDNCSDCMETLRKVGVTTGCRTCPKDGQCELQDIVKKIGVNELVYSSDYRQLPVEKYDPFFDRDYNLCILCGRCVQACSELRFSDVLTFVRRGQRTVIGTAFGRSHLESGCEFCGACVSVCPTGALYEKANKWDGKAQQQVTTTCPFCGVGCQMDLLVKNGEVIGSVPVADELVSDSQLCVKGRFSVTEMVTNPFRLSFPGKIQEGLRKHIDWSEAMSLAAEHLSACKADEFAMLVSPNCTTEALYIAQKFSRVVMGSNHIDTSSRMLYGNAFESYIKLLDVNRPLSSLKEAKTILSIGLDARFDRSVVNVEINKAVKNGARLLTIQSQDNRLDRISSSDLRPVRGSELKLLNALADFCAGIGFSDAELGDCVDSGLLKSFAAALKENAPLVIIIGSEYLYDDEAAEMLQAVYRIAENTKAGVIPLPVHNNFVGSIVAGAYPEFLPGGVSSSNSEKSREIEKSWGCSLSEMRNDWNAFRLTGGEKKKVIYLVGELAGDGRPAADYIIYQNAYPAPLEYQPELVLPSAVFSEEDGVFINQEGRVQSVRKAVEPPAEARPDWQILCMIAQEMGANGFDFHDAAEIRAEMNNLISDWNGLSDPDSCRRQSNSLSFQLEAGSGLSERAGGKNRVAGESSGLLNFRLVENSYYGYPMTTWVAGLRELFAEERLLMHPQDANQAGVGSGDEVVLVTGDGVEKTVSVQIDKNQKAGVFGMIISPWSERLPNPVPVKIRKNDV